MPSTPRQLEPVPHTAVTFTDTFWAPRIERNRTVTIPHIYRQLQETGRIAAFDLNFERKLPARIVEIFSDSDVAKWLEAACLSLATHPDPQLAAQVEAVVDKIIQAQAPDGYLNTHFTAADPAMRWKNLRDWHEMYCMGHMMEAAVAHAAATGSTRLLDALCRTADHIDATFGREEGKRRGYCGHPEIELALIKLYHATQNPRYLELANYFMEERGTQPHYYDQEARERGDDPAKYWAKNYEYCQAHLPLRQQTKVVGHAVRAMYLLCAAADLAHEKKDASWLDTCDRLWQNLVNRRMYLTGGIGPAYHNEGFTEDYDLPDETAYAESCATIGLMMWAERLLQFDGDRRFADVIERGLYNGFLSSISFKGDAFFYENPLASKGGHHRQAFFDCPCCPPNISRVLASLGSYFYSSSQGGVWVHQFAGSQAKLRVDDFPVNLAVETQYPWNGLVKIRVELEDPRTFTLHLRLPGWCKNWSLKVNDEVVDLKPQANGYLELSRRWQNGDLVRYDMEMHVVTTWAHPAVSALRGRIALQRGPLVYCLEETDQPGLDLGRIEVNTRTGGFSDAGVEMRTDLLEGVVVLNGSGTLTPDDAWGDDLYRTHRTDSQPVKLLAVPYYAWDNRATGQMRVWLRESCS
ncbi:MAG TPA: glycoside hydrolase family 127 protein [Anaerolineaceae bacterium]|nr:glycoside hydrolase family 127 protein [Anaerolineaceae bacterium]HPN53160.1 glycoside hydrolase family 127 protein [Anaerolineaceae bacterium]